MKPKIYFTCSISERARDPALRDFFQVSGRIIQEYGELADPHVLRDDVLEYEAQQAKLGVNVHNRDEMLWRPCKITVADVSGATTGGGAEIAEMLMAGKQVLVVYHNSKRGSPYVVQWQHPNLTVQSYGTVEELERIERSFIESKLKRSSLPGKLVVLEGPDGSGKGTQAKRLVTRAAQEGLVMKTMSFPTYDHPSATDVKMYLNGEFGGLEEVGSYRGSVPFCWNRFFFAKQMKQDLQQGVHYALDRFLSSNVGHQGGKIADPLEHMRFIDWLFDFEHRMFGIPVPDLTVFLRVPPVIGQQLVERKAKEQRQYLTEGRTKDIHEASLDHLLRTEEAYLHAANTQPDWVIVECLRQGISEADIANPDLPIEQKLRSIDDIHEEVYRIVQPLFTKA